MIYNFLLFAFADFPCILSNENVLLFDPHKVIDKEGGLIIELNKFVSARRIRSHFESFNTYFGYTGTHPYNGTIFRFPLRTNASNISLPENIYDPDKIRTRLFDPFKQEVENCLLFMKSVYSVKVSVKDNSGTKLLYSVEVDSSFREKLNLYRKNMFEFIQSKFHNHSSRIFITIFPTCFINCDQTKTVRLWLVMNMLGLPDQAGRSGSRQFESYLPWFAVALPLPHSQHTLHALLDQDCCWSEEFIDTALFFSFIDNNIPSIPLSCEMRNFVGNLFCFLPIAASSKLPFHIHGYFALSTNRRFIKWPRFDDLSDEAKWNKDLVEQLGTISYAVLIHLAVSRFRTQGRSMLHYSLWSCLPSDSETDELQSIIHSGALHILRNSKLVCSKLDSTWIELCKGYYLPSSFGRTIPHEEVCTDLLLKLSQPIVELTPEVSNVIRNYEFLEQQLSESIISPALIRQMLIRFESETLIYFLRHDQNVYALLEIVLCDLDFSSNDVSDMLEGIQLIPVSNSELPVCFGDETCFISDGSQDFSKIFPGRYFVKRSLPHPINVSLLSLSRSGRINIQDITNIRSDARYFVDFLQSSMKAFFSFDFPVVWTPGLDNQPDKSWIEQVWKFIDQDKAIIGVLKKHQLPLLPKQDLHTPRIDLLPLSTTTMPYFEHSSTPTHSGIEQLIRASGCHICHRHAFILPYHEFVQPSIPRGLLSILKLPTEIQISFVKNIANASISIVKSLINAILSIESMDNAEENLIKSFPIFLLIGETYYSALDRNTSYCIPHDLIPIELDCFPSFINPRDNLNVRLCWKLGIKSISFDEMIQYHLLPLISSNSLTDQPKKRKYLSLWILRNFSLLNEDARKFLSNTKWLLDSNANPNLRGQFKLFSPSNLCDPQDTIMSQLMCVQETGIEGIFPNEIYNIDYLRALGLQSSSKLEFSILERNIKKAIENVEKIRDYKKWISALVQLISLHMIEFDLRNRHNFWNNLFKFSKFILSNGSYFKPSESYLCSEHNSCLIEGMAPLIVDKSDESCNYGAIFRCMGFETTFPISLVCQKLKSLVSERSNINHQDLFHNVKEIYKYFQQEIFSDNNVKREIDLPDKFVYIPEFGFYDTGRVVLSCDDILTPHVFSLEKYYGKIFTSFFTTFDIDLEITFLKCQFILEQLQILCLSPSEVKLALRVVQMSADLIHEFDQSLVIAQDCMIYPADQCVFNDLPWMERSELATIKPIVHSGVSNTIANKIGCLPASLEMTPTAESISYSFISDAGQSEDLVQRLRGILEGYRVQWDVFSELIQNSDDAGAKQVKILFDYKSHPCSSVLHKNMEGVHGPALYVFNDSRFTDQDFASILKLSSGNKLNDPSKVGRFGVGFNAVYNFTDCPSFVSDRRVQIFDPLRKYIGPLSRDSGIKIRFTDDEAAISTFQDQFRVYQDIFDCDILNRNPYKYTLFRLPFRTNRSQLSDKTFSCEAIAELQKYIIREIPNFILFLQNVTSIEVYERSIGKNSIDKLLTISKSECPTTHFLQNNKKYFENYLLKIRENCRPDSVKSVDRISICKDSQEKKCIISYATGVKECFDVLKKFTNSGKTFLPLCGVTVPLENIENTPRNPGKLYTFLPLTIRSPLPLHINGYFSLSTSRKNLSDVDVSSSENTDLRTDWNIAIFNDALSNALICALEALPQFEPLRGSGQAEHYKNYYSLWPVKDNPYIIWKAFPEYFARRIVESFSSSKLFSCAHDPSVWVSFDEISFLSVNHPLDNDFLQFIYTKAYQHRLIFAYLPSFFMSTKIYKIFAELKPEKVFDLKKICEGIIFQNVANFPLEKLVLIFNSLIPLCIEDSENWLLNSLCNVAFIPCGSIESGFQLRKPSEVVCPNTKIASLYQRDEMRIPVSELHEQFDLSKLELISTVLKKMGVIYERLPECEVISRCHITSTLNVEESTRHATTLIEYLSREDRALFDSIYPQIKSISFIPTHKDDLFETLSIDHIQFTSPEECYTFSCRHFVSPLYPCASNAVSIPPRFEINSVPSTEIVLECLNTLISEVDCIKDCDFNIDEKFLEIYKNLSRYETNDPEMDLIREKLKDGPWIWHPDYKQFYPSNQVILSTEFKTLDENKYIIAFPYIDPLRDLKFKRFLITVGVKEGIDDNTIIVCLHKICEEFGAARLPQNLVRLVLKLISLIDDCESCRGKIYLLSQTNILQSPCKLHLFNISPRLQNKDLNLFVHQEINHITASILGAKTSEELFSTNIDLNESDFGVEEEITDRIQSLVRDIPMANLVKELIQNAEDAKATEIVFILDDQDYTRCGETLSLPGEVYPNWKLLHSVPSLSVYNNKGFTEEDLEGIQTLSVGGKAQYRKSIGKFGLGFNSVYQITDAPTFITTQNGQEGLTFCCIDPFIKYTATSFDSRSYKEKRGKRIDVKSENYAQFPDQFFPFKFDEFSENPEMVNSLANLWINSEFTMFRFPLDICCNLENSKIPYSKVESRKHCSLESLKNTIIDQLNNCPEMLLFLNNVQSLKVVSIDNNQKLTLECLHTFQTLDSIPRPIPDYFPRINTEDNLKVQRKSCTISFNFRKSQFEYVVYFFPESDIEQYLSSRPELEQFRGKLCEEKLWGFGAIAVCISDYHPVKRFSLFNFLPFPGDQFPVFINAPLISDASRQHFSNQFSDWREAWHSSITETILVPLYTLLLYDLREPSQPLNCLEAKQEYFKWFYSLFPDEGNDPFLANLSRTLYSFLYKINQPILLCDNLDMLAEGDEPKWYTLHGPDCGVIKPTDELTISNTEQINTNDDTESKRKEYQLRKSLILIQFPLSLAPNCFKDFRLVKLNQSLLLSHLNNNKHSLFQANASSYCLNSSKLDFEQFQTILEYILTAGDELFTRNPIIPLCIDIENNVGCFRRDKPSFRHQFSPLLPHCSDRFISEGYLPSIVAKMSMHGYVCEMDCSFLSKHLDVEKFDKPEQYSLFWEFVIQNNLDIEDLNCFSKHKLVPVKSDDVPCTFYPIQDLKYMVSQTLNDVTKFPILFNALTALGCPLLFFEFFDRYSCSQSKIKSYLDKIAISQLRAGEFILGSLSFCTNLAANLEPKEASKLYHIFSQMNPGQFNSRRNLDIISELKLFQALSGEYLSLNQCERCFMNIESLHLGPEILGILQDGYNLVIFRYHEENFLKLLFSKLQKELVDVKGLLLRFIFPNFPSLQIKEQKNILSLFAQKLAGGRIDQESINLINVLREIPFICLEDHNYTIKNLYSYESDFFCKFLAFNTLPEIWRDDNFRHLFNVLGLQNIVTLKDILKVAHKFSRDEIPFENLPYLLDTLADILNKMTFEHNFDPNSTEVLQQIKQVKFLPAWIMEDILINQSPHQLELVRFCDAQLNEFEHCCSTTAWIHEYPFKIPPACYRYLGIIEQPDPDLVKKHLIKITRQLMSYEMNNISDDLSKCFTSSYEYLESHYNTYTNFNELFDLACILCQGELYCPINMLFTSSEGLSPFVIQLPLALAGRCPNFFSRIGVEMKANYKHFALVLLSIHAYLETSNIELNDSRYLQQAETVFNHLIHALRELDNSCTPLNLDLAQIILLTNDSRLFPSGEVVFGDNPSLLSRINELQLQFNILKPLEPDENKSCVPPLCLRLRKLNELVREEINPNVYRQQIPNGTLANYLKDRLRNRTVFSAMRRLYFHLTRKDLEKLLLRNGETCFDDGQPHPGFLSVSQLLHNLQVISVEQIDLLIIDNQQISHPLTNSCGCYIDGNNQFLISQCYSTDTCIYKDIAFAINTHLGNIFTEALSPFELCFMLCPTKLMDKLNQYNIAIDPWTQQPPIHPQRMDVPIAVTPPLPTPDISTDHPMAINTVTCRVPMYGPRLNPENMGITMGEPDIPAAKRWLMVSQCDMYAADRLMAISCERGHLFPAHACFCSFEAVVKAFIALLHYKGSSNRPEFERNLRFYLDHLKFLIPSEDIRNEIERYIIPLMNYDMETRVPSVTCTPGMGCYIPQQIFTADQAIEARTNARLFIQLLIREFPEMNAMVLNESEAMLRSQPSPNPPIIAEIITCKLKYYG